MTFAELADVLQTEEEFEDLDDWTIASLTGGGTSPHTYRLTSSHADYFVKETQDNERNTLQLLAGLELDVCPRVVYPGLLGHNVLVAEYIPGGHLRAKALEPALVASYAAMQNALNNWDTVVERCPDTPCGFCQTDGGRYRDFILEGCRDGYARLIDISRLGLPILDDFTRLADRVVQMQEALAGAYSAMPFGWLHHDFREENIVGRPQRLVDWGSSYGHGPFLFDLAPFLLIDTDALDVFASHSDICRDASREQIEEWLHVAGLASFLAFLLWRLPRAEQGEDGQARRAEWTRYLEYEFEPYRVL